MGKNIEYLKDCVQNDYFYKRISDMFEQDHGIKKQDIFESTLSFYRLSASYNVGCDWWSKIVACPKTRPHNKAICNCE